MPINLHLDPEAQLGKSLLRWTFQEFKHPQRGRAWWIMAGLVGLGLIVSGVATGNFLFALIILIGATIFVNESRRRPRQLESKITSTGVAVGKKFWRYTELANFWIAYRPPEIMNLYLVPKNPLDPRVRVPLGRINPIEVRKLLAPYVTEDLSREDEPTSEALSRLLKLQ